MISELFDDTHLDGTAGMRLSYSLETTGSAGAACIDGEGNEFTMCRGTHNVKITADSVGSGSVTIVANATEETGAPGRVTINLEVDRVSRVEQTIPVTFAENTPGTRVELTPVDASLVGRQLARVPGGRQRRSLD